MKVLGKIMISGMSALVFLSAFCLMYSYDKLHIAQPFGSTDYTEEPYSYMAQMDEGFSWNIMDSNGYNNESTFDTIDILVMGSSQMEAGRLPQDEGITNLLNTRYLPRYHSYSIGRSGHRIYTCMENLAAAYEQFKPSKYVVMDLDNTKLEYDSMNLVMEDKFPETDYISSNPIKKCITNYIPAIGKIRASLIKWSEKNQTQYNENVNVDIHDYEIVLNDFLGHAENVLGGGYEADHLISSFRL